LDGNITLAALSQGNKAFQMSPEITKTR